jgi:sigma-E factor negative regulatory protein RseC
MVTEEIGIVKSVTGVIAVVNVPRKSACEGCTAGCKMDEEFMEIEAFNQAGAKVGQTVRVTMKAFTYTKGSLLVYGLPAVALVIGAVFGKEVMGRTFPHEDPDILSAVFGFGAFIVSFFFVKFWSNRTEKKVESKPIVEEILEGKHMVF